MAAIPLYLSGFAKYLAASPQRAGTVARLLISRVDAPYDPRTDYWKSMRSAVVADRRTSRDGRAVWAAADNATGSKKAQYAAVARGWEQVIPRWEECAFLAMPTLAVDIGGLTVKIPSGFAELHPDGDLEVVYTHLNRDPMPNPLPEAIMRVLQRRHPQATVTYLDVHRPDRTQSSRGLDLAPYDAWLDQAGMYLAYVLTQQAAA